MLIKQSTARNRMILMVNDTDHITGETGLTLTITASKNGGAFAGISPTVTERGDGWYSLALTTSHTDTLGDLALHITGSGADPTDMVDEVVSALPGETQPANLTAVLGTAITESGSGDAAGALTTFLDVATPTLTCESIDQTGDSFARLGTPIGASISADIAALPTDEENADVLLARNIEGGSSTGRTVTQALQRLRNRTQSNAGVLTVYDIAGNPSWSANLTSDAAAEPITQVAPT